MSKGGYSGALSNKTMLTNGDMASSVNSENAQVSLVTGFSIQSVFSGAPVGNLKLQVSNDGTNFYDYPGSSANISSAGTIIWNVGDVYFQWVKVVYTRTSGTGTLNITLTYK